MSQGYTITISGEGSGPLPRLERLAVAVDEKAELLYDMVSAATGVPIAQQRLWWDGNLLERDELLTRYGQPTMDWERVTLLVEPLPPPPDDRAVLTALYASCGGPEWRRSEGWLGDGPLSSWYGVSVDSEGRVTGLELENNKLIGTPRLPISKASGRSCD